MRKSVLYLPGAYAGYDGKYTVRNVWRERWGRMTKKALAAVLLGLAVGSLAAQWKLEEGRLSAGAAESSSVRISGSSMGADCLQEAWKALPDPASKQREQRLAYGFELDPTRPLVVLDPGHGGADEGCSREGVREKEINLQIALAARNHLEELGYQVLLTRDADQDMTLEARAQIANDVGADLYVSIHQNADEAVQAEGIEVWYSSRNAGEESERLSRLIEKFAVQDTGAQEREIRKEEELYIIRECTMPSCLVETGFLSNTAERGKLVSTEYQEQIARGIASGIDLYFHPKTMYLTFDDGPSAENTAAVLDILKERDIKATFFLVGENVEKHPEIARRIAEEGHTVGIHCYRHDYGELYQNVDSYVADFEKAHAIVKEVTGVDAKLFRFPGGSINSYNKAVYEDIARAMTEKGYVYYDWNASLEDAVTRAEPEVLIENALSSTLGRKKVVMLAHDVVYQTTQCLEELLDRLPEYRMEVLTEDVEPVQF